MRYDWDRSAAEDDREGPRMVRKRSEHDFDGFDRRKGFDRGYGSGGGSGGGGGGESRGGYDRGLMHRSESFCGSGRRDFPKGFRSERDRPRREGSATSWRRIGIGGKEFDDVGGGSRNNRLEERGKAGLRDVRSPTWSNSRDSGSDQSRVRPSPPRGGLKDGGGGGRRSKSKSPTWSKDSVGSEQSKYVEVKKSDEVQVESGSSSEMEEGELEPEPDSELKSEVARETEADAKPAGDVVADADSEKEEGPSRIESSVGNKKVEDDKGKGESSRKEAMEKMDRMEIYEQRSSDIEVDGLLSHKANLGTEKMESSFNDETETRNDRDGEREKILKGVTERKDEVAQGSVEEKHDQIEAETLNTVEKGLSKEITEENVVIEEGVVNEIPENSAPQSFKDKGKGVAVTPTHVDEPTSDGNWTDREARDLTICGDSDMEGPSARGFELFGNSPVRRQEKAAKPGTDSLKEEKLGLEPLDLTLSLPNVLLPIGATPGSPGRATSVQSLSNTFRTNSDGFTASVSYSGSQSFYHNPSCSMTQNSLDNLEQSVKSRPIFQGIDWQALAQNEAKNKDVPLYQRVLMNGNNSQSHQQSQANPNAQSSQPQPSSGLYEGSSKMPNGLERQLSFHKQPPGHSRHRDDVKSPAQSVGSHDIGSNYSFDKKRMMREKSSGSLYRSSSSKMDQDQFLNGGADFADAVIGRIVSDPIQSMARKFHEMTGQPLACLKDSIRAILLNPDKRRQLSALQKVLLDRPDITSEILQKSHRTQLEILVALKTGVPDFLQQETSISTSELAEIFMNSRCRNPACQSHVPVDECDCKVCGQKSGFCSSCMCLVCSKFDMASNTCSWVGCDVCLHWCHADCGLRESYIRNGRSATGPHGSFEMQFHCVACDHPSEMFGFVKEVFQNFAKDWTAETLSKELEYVKRIFAASKDLRGRRLHEIAGQMLVRLTNKSELPDVYNYVMGFLSDSDSFKLSSVSLPTVKKQSKQSHEIAGPSQEPSWLKSVFTEKVSQLDISASLLPSYSYDRNDKRVIDLDIHTSTTPKEPLFDELDSIVRAKQAEAKLFQSRANDARQEAEGLQRIAIAKNEKIEEEYTGRIAQLRLSEAEQARKQKFEELQALERSHREYFNMKMRMEAEIKDLLVKMEATKRNLAA